MDTGRYSASRLRTVHQLVRAFRMLFNSYKNGGNEVSSKLLKFAEETIEKLRTGELPIETANTIQDLVHSGAVAEYASVAAEKLRGNEEQIERIKKSWDEMMKKKKS